MTEWLVVVLITIGTLFSLLAAIGIVRMPDLYMRAQVVTKASTLGTSCLALAAAVSFEGMEPAVRLMLVVAFLFLTAPIAAHMIGRSAKAQGVPLWAGTNLDEMGNAPYLLESTDQEEIEQSDEP
ncbi:MAG: monovalent cation/H(+) antiporter subunit G [Planctomycetota bacterium]|nr:MAG: monovalent cation/H(+) antiporter subunit G [Planctomycetota bacterium]